MKKKLLFLYIGLLLPFLPVAAQSFVKPEKGDFQWRIIGRAMFDGGVFFDDVTPLGNGAVLTDARIGLMTTFLENWEGKVEFGYNSGKMGIRDVYLAYKRSNHMLQIGHFYEPFGIESRVGTADYRLMNPAMSASTLGDKRKIGLGYIYNVDNFTFAAGLFSDSDVDNAKEWNEGYTLAAKFTGRPVWDNVTLVHLAVAGRFSEHDQEERGKFTYSAGVPTSVLSSSKNKFISAPVTDMINQRKFGAELIIFHRWIYFQSEYLMASINRFGGENYTANGGYVQVGALFLGNRQYKYNRRQGMVTNPEGKNLEVLFRYNITDLNDRDAAIMGGTQQDFTVGANYFINKYLAVRLNYVHAMLDKHALNGKEKFDYIQARFQFSF